MNLQTEIYLSRDQRLLIKERYGENAGKHG